MNESWPPSAASSNPHENPWRRLLWFAHRDRFERELDEEMRHHLALKSRRPGGIRAARQFGNATMECAVARRTTEIGIRMALATLRRRVVWLVLRDVPLLAAIGVALDPLLVFETTAFLKSLLFGLQPNDPIALAAAATILVACAFLTGYIPA